MIISLQGSSLGFLGVLGHWGCIWAMLDPANLSIIGMQYQLCSTMKGQPLSVQPTLTFQYQLKSYSKNNQTYWQLLLTPFQPVSSSLMAWLHFHLPSHFICMFTTLFMFFDFVSNKENVKPMYKNSACISQNQLSQLCPSPLICLKVNSHKANSKLSLYSLFS
jgi:hypothetical protein